MQVGNGALLLHPTMFHFIGIITTDPDSYTYSLKLHFIQIKMQLAALTSPISKQHYMH